MSPDWTSTGLGRDDVVRFFAMATCKGVELVSFQDDLELYIEMTSWVLIELWRLEA